MSQGFLHVLQTTIYAFGVGVGVGEIRFFGILYLVALNVPLSTCCLKKNWLVLLPRFSFQSRIPSTHPLNQSFTSELNSSSIIHNKNNKDDQNENP